MSRDQSLQALRREIDEVDDRIHDLIIRRTEVVREVSALKHDLKVKIRPTREAEILYRLVGRHQGPFPKRELVRIWRELIVATLSMEGPFSVSVYVPEEGGGYWDLARDQYGSFTPMTAHGSMRRVIDSVRSQETTVGVLPLPRREDADPWWRYLATVNPEAPRIIARLPLAGADSGRGERPEALVVCPVDQEPSSRDRTFMAFEAEGEIGLQRLESALSGAGFSPCFTALWREADETGPWLYLAELDGFIAPGERRLSTFAEGFEGLIYRTIPLGGYAVPFDHGELASEDAGSGP